VKVTLRKEHPSTGAVLEVLKEAKEKKTIPDEIRTRLGLGGEWKYYGGLEKLTEFSVVRDRPPAVTSK